MNWSRMQHDWQQRDAALAAPSITELQQRDRALGEQVRRRDRLETLAAAVVAALFAVQAGIELWRGQGWVAGFALLLVVWALLVPWRLRRTRAEGADIAADTPLLASLQARRRQALAQARMLEQAWLWYAAPCLAGLVGMTLAESGPTPAALAYIGLLGVSAVALAIYNRWHARRRFRAHAAELQVQIEALQDAAS